MTSLRLALAAALALTVFAAGCWGFGGKPAPETAGARAAAAVERAPSRDARGPLDEVGRLLVDLDSGDVVRCWRAEEALGEMGASVAPRTRAALGAAYPEARAAACRLAFKFRDEAAIPGMIALLDDDSRLVRSTANVFLCGLTDQDFGFRPDAAAPDRAAARAAWEAWRAKTYGPRLAPKRP